ncbi:MAG: hypothetical protein JW981_07530 [Anaerolineae bacterium]|nr:hypothetical protein [Anaerolineae bacterium]
MRNPIAKWGIVAVLFVLSIACTIPIPTTEPLTLLDPPADVYQSLGSDGAQAAEINLRMLSRQLTLRPDIYAELLNAHFHYNVAEWEPKIDQKTANGVTDISIRQGMGGQLTLGDSADDYINNWEIGLAPNIPVDLGVDLGTGAAQLDLGGLSLTGFSLTTGSSDAVLNFSDVNPEPMSRLRLTAGTGSLTASGLGNANFDQLSVFGGAGSIDLDFSGNWKRSALAHIRAGAGTIYVRVPSAIGVRVQVSGALNRVDTGAGFTKRGDNEYTNAAYGQAPLTLTIEITTGVGAIRLVSM